MKTIWLLALICIGATIAVEPFVLNSFFYKLGLRGAGVPVWSDPITLSFALQVGWSTVAMAAALCTPIVMAQFSFRSVGRMSGPEMDRDRLILSLERYNRFMAVASALVAAIWILTVLVVPDIARIFFLVPLIATAVISYAFKRNFLSASFDGLIAYVIWAAVVTTLWPLLDAHSSVRAIAAGVTLFAIPTCAYAAALFIPKPESSRALSKAVSIAGIVALIPYFLALLLNENVRLDRVYQAARAMDMFSESPIEVAAASLPTGHQRDFSSRQVRADAYEIAPRLLVKYGGLSIACTQLVPFITIEIQSVRNVMQRCIVIQGGAVIQAVEYPIN